jgi:predicted enzyme related to lactoylglutathione lyase
MSLELSMLTFDCQNAVNLARFWSVTLGRPVDPGASEEYAGIGAVDESPSQVAWLFVNSADRKQGTSGFHPDLTSPDWEAEADRLVSLGATRQGAFDVDGIRWIALTDPEGNRFNVFAPRPNT